jgi:hypothetical protein
MKFGLHYLDVETGGFDPIANDIITIQYQPINAQGEAIGDLVILKSWESSEEEIVRQFYKKFVTDNYSVWGFISVGTNLLFDMRFIIAKFQKYGLDFEMTPLDFLFSKPHIDIRNNLIIANDMQFKGCGLDSMTTKTEDGRNIPIWFAEKKYDLIENYIRMETEAFLKAFRIIIDHSKDLKSKLK